MFGKKAFGLAVAALAMLAPVSAAQALQCVPFARDMSGVDIRGNAHTWWAQAAGKYARGNTPKVGAVLSFKSTRSMPLGHVAVVSKIINDREILISHSNWSPINGRRGQIERNVKVVDVSANGDWTSVKVWYAPIGALGLRANPTNGFIYNGRGDRGAPIQIAQAEPIQHPAFAKTITPSPELAMMVAAVR